MAMFGRTPRILLAALALACLLITTGCQTSSPWRDSGAVSDEQRQADQLAAQGDYAGAAALYESAGAVARGDGRTSLLLSAAASYLSAGDAGAAENVMRQISTPSRDPLAARYRITSAELRLAQNRPQEALNALGRAPSTGATAQDQQRYYQVLAAALGRQHNVAGEADALMHLHDVAADRSEREAYQQQILRVVIGLDETQRGELRQLGHPDSYGWLALAETLVAAGAGPADRERAFAQWRLQYPNHPASGNSMARLAGTGPAVSINWQGGAAVGVLLPFTGPYQKAAEALREGIMAAFFGLPTEQRPALRYYDTGSQSNVAALYQQAVNEGAQLVIGPLTKDAVSALKQTGLFQIPVLALNHTDDVGLPPQGLYQFALSPEDEGRFIAERAYQEGFGSAAVLIPDNGSGDRYLDSFRYHWESAGGLIAAIAAYSTEEHHLAAPVKEATNSGADFVYVIGKPLKARQLRTQVQYFGRADAPVFVSAQALQDMLPTSLNQDLNGARLPGMPWLLSPPPGDADTVVMDELQAMRDGASAIEPGYGPFYAMGYDALRLGLTLNQLTFGAAGIDGATGHLSLDADGTVRREPAWMTYANGRAVPLPAPAASIYP